MKVKRTVAPDMRQAIRMVRDEHGPDAVIVSSRDIQGGVEVLSVLDPDPQWTVDAGEPLRPPTKTAPAAPAEAVTHEPSADFRTALAAAEAPRFGADRAAPRRGPAERPADERSIGDVFGAADGLGDGAVDPELDDLEDAGGESLESLRRELQSMRGLLQAELAALAGDVYAQREPVRSRVARRLERLGVSHGDARSLVDDLQDVDDARTAAREALARLARRIPVVERNLMLRGGTVALVGPSGVGKTATLMKLASNFRAAHGRQSVAVIAVDCDRLAAERELDSLGRELGIYTLVASGRDELLDALETVSDRRLVLIDTAGMSYRDPRLSETARLLDGIPGVEPWLVLSANTQRANLEAVIRRYRAIDPRACVLTRLDECTSLGEALGATTACGLPLSFVSTGRSLDEDLQPANGQWLVRRMVELDRELRPRTQDARAVEAPATRSGFGRDVIDLPRPGRTGRNERGGRSPTAARSSSNRSRGIAHV